MPKLWSETVDAHRTAVRDAILRTTAELAAERGPASVKMSQIAEQVGIGRATLYKYFPDVDSVLIAWHERHVADHLAQLTALRGQGGTPVEQLEAVLTAYAFIAFHRGRRNAEIAALVHRGEPVARAEQQLLDLFQDLLAEAAATGRLRDDVAADELAGYCLHALTAAGSLPSEAAVHRLVTVTLTGLHSPVTPVSSSPPDQTAHPRNQAHRSPHRGAH